MTSPKDPVPHYSRRDFIKSTGLTTLVLGTGTAGGAMAANAATDSASATSTPPSSGPFNILFILTDQERFFGPGGYPPGFGLPARDRLQRRGVTFANHQINSAVCTSSRSVIYTGQHIQHTKQFDNHGFPWTESMSTEIPTVGDMLGEAGYFAAYKGKWHLSEELGTSDEYAVPQEKLTKNMELYGFKDYVGIGDVIGKTQGGYLNDEIIGAQARRWLRLRGQPLTRQGQPWYLAVNIVNPHDVMFYNTDPRGQHVQDVPKTLFPIVREPDARHYRQQWDVRLPTTRHELFDKPGRPSAHREYQRGRGALVGNFPDEDARWQRLLNYYFNCIQHTDRVIEGVLDELESLGLADNTIVVLTADHGELGGAHGTHGKGATAYNEQNHVPLVVSHPGYPETHGQQCAAVTTHLDLAPSLVTWTGVDTKNQAAITQNLRGHDLTPLLQKGSSAGPDELRNGSLYCFNMFLYMDSDYLTKVQAILNGGGSRKDIVDQGLKPDFSKRAGIRSVFDGRYKYSRYFSPKQHNQPQTLEGIFELNDVELFDLETDPHESDNLAIEPKKHGDLILAMNQKMNKLIETEIGEPDDGSFLPGEDADWAATKFDP